jgi:hypothetical protein
MATYTKTLTETQIFRKTNGCLGRHISVTPANSTNRHLSCFPAPPLSKRRDRALASNAMTVFVFRVIPLSGFEPADRRVSQSFPPSMGSTRCK